MNLKKYEHIMRVRFGKPYYPSEGELIQNNNFIDFEEKKKLILPEIFKLFYLEYNGCCFGDADFMMFSDILKQHISYGQITQEGYLVTISQFYALEHIENGWYPGQPSWDAPELEDYDKIPYSQWPLAVQNMNPLKRGWDPILWKQYLVIGDGNEQFILMGIASENLGKIYYWDSNFDNIYNPLYLADSIPELLDKTEAMQTFNQT